MKIVVSF